MTPGQEMCQLLIILYSKLFTNYQVPLTCCFAASGSDSDSDSDDVTDRMSDEDMKVSDTENTSDKDDELYELFQQEIKVVSTEIYYCLSCVCNPQVFFRKLLKFDTLVTFKYLRLRIKRGTKHQNQHLKK